MLKVKKGKLKVEKKASQKLRKAEGQNKDKYS